jgi:hypothetical protein
MPILPTNLSSSSDAVSVSDHIDESSHQNTPWFKGYLLDMVLHHFLADGPDGIGVHRTSTSCKYTSGLISFTRELPSPSPISRTWSCVVFLMLATPPIVWPQFRSPQSARGRLSQLHEDDTGFTMTWRALILCQLQPLRGSRLTGVWPASSTETAAASSTLSFVPGVVMRPSSHMYYSD